MNTRKMCIFGIFTIIIALAFTACPPEPDHTHDWGNWIITTPATCTTQGIETRVCTDPSHIETRYVSINPNAHSWGNWTQTKAPTETVDGEETRTCSFNTAHKETHPITAPNHIHQWGEWEVTIAPTATKGGLDTRTCKLDATHKETRNTSATGAPGHIHDWGEYETIAPTCTTEGMKTRTCKTDSTHKETQPIEPIGHNYQWIGTPPAAETTNGLETYICQHDNTHTNGTRTAYATGTVGLSFTLINSNTAYRVSRGTATGAIHIPAYRLYNGNYLPVTEIGNGTNTERSNAFGGSWDNPNTTVTSVTFAAESPLTTISTFAFQYCTSLTSINIPEGVTSIGSNTFSECHNLASVNIPEDVTSIGDYAFLRNNSLTSITLPASVTTIGVGAFANGGLISINIPANVTTIGDYAFSNCYITTITIPVSVTSIGESAFRFWLSAQTIYVDVSETESVATWGTDWLRDCYATVIYKDTHTHNYSNWIITTPATCSTAGVETRTCTNPPTHTETRAVAINQNAHNWGQWITTPATETQDGIETRTCAYNPSHKETHPSGEYATGTAGLAYELINNNTAYRVRKGSVSGAVVIPATYNGLPVTEIGSLNDSPSNGAFANTNITSIIIPASVTTIGYRAFHYCSNLTTITFAAGSQLQTIGYYAFEECHSLTSITLPSGVTTINPGTFQYCTGLISITIPNSVTSIQGGAFESCTSLTSIIIPSSVTSIYGGAFESCTSIISITIPASVTGIGNGVFYGWTSSQTIYIRGKNNQAAADNAGGRSNWRDGCNANIIYGGN